MSWRLGLDLGTNSIGWCALKLDGQGLPEDVLASGVRLLTPNQEAGRDPQSKVSLAAERREARSARRRRDRFLRRQKRLMQLLIKEGLMPAEETARKALEKLDPYVLRAKALTEPLTPHELGRALFHLNQRRGFKSNRVADAGDEEKGATKEGMRALQDALQEAGAETLGALLASRHAKRETVRFRPTAQGAKNIYEFYPSREMVEREIDTIWARQKPHHKQLTDELLARVKYIIAGQRKLKKPPIGRCTFRPEEDRAPRALPLFQRYRILTDLHNLKIEQPGTGTRRLTLAERDALASLLMSRSGTVTFEAMRKALNLPEDARFNYEGGNRKGFEPDLSAKILAHKDRFGSAWRGLPRDRQNEIVTRLLEDEDEEELTAWLEENCNLSPRAAEFTSNARLPQGYGHLGRSMLADLVDVLETESAEAVDPSTGEVYQAPITYDEAVKSLDLRHSDFRPSEQQARLPYYGDVLPRHVIAKPDAPEGSQERRGKLPNPTVHIALNQVRKLVNALIDEYGPPYEIVIELARELKWNQQRKDEHNKELRKNTEANEKRKAKLAELGQADTGENRLRLKLYEELLPDERICVYSGTPISINDLFSGAIEIDHILPFSKTLDDSFLNKVLCTREANRRKGNRPPADAFSAAELEEIAERARRVLDPRKAKRFLPDAMERFDDAGGWQARHLTDTQHMARTTKEYLGHICDPDRVWTVPGRMTAMLRGLWGLDKLLPGHNLPEGKNRADHRHHAIDAFVVANLDRALLNKISRAAGRGEELHAERLFPNGVPEPFENFRNALQKSLDAIIVSHKMDHGVQGQLHEDTAYGLVDEKIDGKRFNLVVRKPLAALTEKEITQIRDPLWRAQLLELAMEVKRDGGKLSDALAKFGEEHDIRRVRVLKTEGAYITIRHGDGYEKAYVPGDNHRMEIFELQDGKWDFETVSVFQANQKGYVPEWRQQHPEAKHVMTLHKGDMLEAELGGVKNWWVIYRLNPASSRIWVAPHTDAGDQSARAWQRPSISTLQRVGAKLVRLDPLGRIRNASTREAIK